MTAPVSATRRAVIVAAARSWIGTPYRHQASVRGVGADCLGLVRGVWREIIGPEPEPCPPYAPDWTEPGGADLLGAAMARWLTPCPSLAAAGPGDVVLFRMHPHAPPRHAAIMSAAETLVHAYWARAVVESRYARWWRDRAACAFAFPGAEPWPS